MNGKKYQVFISSTYTDLIEERKKVLEVLLMADCIPAGMEAFVASDMEQFEVIKKVIDLCDYYILLIGRRYGSVHPETGKSYTEMEYDYAREKNIPVLVFAVDESIETDDNKKEKDNDKKERLGAFRKKALSNRLASIWKTMDDLTGKVAISIMKAKTEIKRPGWQRAVDYDEVSLRREIMELKSQNEQLENDLERAKKEIVSLTDNSDYAFEDEKIELKYHYSGQYGVRHDSIQTNLEEIFKIIATEMLNVSISEILVESAIKSYFFKETYNKFFDDSQIIKKLLNQYRALNLVTAKWKDKALYWGLTEKGERVRDEMILIKKK